MSVELAERGLPDARVVNAFNMVGDPHRVDPDFPDGQPLMFVCGNESDAKLTAGSRIDELGWPSPVDLSGIEISRYLEPMAMAWIVHFLNQGFDPGLAFSVLRE